MAAVKKFSLDFGQMETTDEKPDQIMYFGMEVGPNSNAYCAWSIISKTAIAMIWNFEVISGNCNTQRVLRNNKFFL